MTTSTRHLTSAALALASALVLTACGGGSATATSDAGSGGGMDHGGSTASSAPSTTTDQAAMSNDADLAFLTGMKPHHEQAVEMSDSVLAADPPAPVAELAQQVKAAQGPEIEQIDQMLADLGAEDGEGGEGHSAGGHGGMMSEADMTALMDATGAEAARLYLEGMIEHHEGAVEAAETELAEGEHEPARTLATSITQDQAAEITEMQALLAAL